jgi:iron-sulfur cluster assembly protein/iron-sulfur cluster insertion protein
MIILTENAASKVDQLISEEVNAEALALRVAVKPGGCSGYEYDLFFDSEVEANDSVATFGAVKVVVDPTSAQLLDGATLDYKDGLAQQGFAIDNPNAQRTCGCGSSFS